jgi:hypothetical protein
MYGKRQRFRSSILALIISYPASRFLKQPAIRKTSIDVIHRRRTKLAVVFLAITELSGSSENLKFYNLQKNIV